MRRSIVAWVAGAPLRQPRSGLYQVVGKVGHATASRERVPYREHVSHPCAWRSADAGLLERLTLKLDQKEQAVLLDIAQQLDADDADVTSLDTNAIDLGPMEQRLDEEWTLDRLASAAHLSKEHLRRLCSSSLGRAPIQHVAFLRMHYAAELLATTDQTIAQIAQQVGYEQVLRPVLDVAMQGCSHSVVIIRGGVAAAQPGALDRLCLDTAVVDAEEALRRRGEQAVRPRAARVVEGDLRGGHERGARRVRTTGGMLHRGIPPS